MATINDTKNKPFIFCFKLGTRPLLKAVPHIVPPLHGLPVHNSDKYADDIHWFRFLGLVSSQKIVQVSSSQVFAKTLYHAHSIKLYNLPSFAALED